MKTIEIVIESLPAEIEAETLTMLDKGVDFFLFSGDLPPGIERPFARYIDRQKKHSTSGLILTTPGGSADTSYSIARRLNRLYDTFGVIVTGYCKSAGTLLALGANELIIAPDAEFGPLDVQLFSPDEFMKRSSGLSISQAMRWLNEQSFNTFEQIFLSLRGRSGANITTKTAGDFASTIVGTLYSSITDKVDPVTIGEMQRAVDIALEYGKRLGASEDVVNHLVNDYPSHGFVIDSEEALTLFPNARPIKDGEYRLLREVGAIFANEFGTDFTIEPSDRPILATITITEGAIREAKGQVDIPGDCDGNEPLEKVIDSTPRTTDGQVQNCANSFE
jgi:hypothetical protein